MSRDTWVALLLSTYFLIVIGGGGSIYFQLRS